MNEQLLALLKGLQFPNPQAAIDDYSEEDFKRVGKMIAEQASRAEPVCNDMEEVYSKIKGVDE